MAKETYSHGNKYVNKIGVRKACCDCCECNYGYKLSDIISSVEDGKKVYYVTCPECNDKYYLLLSKEETNVLYDEDRDYSF
jgi:Zn finger protein HypA/HybF involved in hydrogenase expression